MGEWIDVLASDNDDDPTEDEVQYKDRTDYIIEVLMGGALGEEEIKTLNVTYFEAPDVFISDEPELYYRYDIWRYKEIEE